MNRSVITLAILVSLLAGAPALAQIPPTEWQQYYGDAGEDHAGYVRETDDGGFIMTGHTNSLGAGNFDVYLVKLDAMGDPQWERVYGGSDEDIGYAVRQTADGGYIVTGSTFSYGAGSNDLYLLRTDAAGDVVWERSYGDELTDHGRGVEETADGGFIVIGSSTPPDVGSSRIYVLRVDANGEEIWSRFYGSGGSNYGHEVRELPGGRLAIAGMTYPVGPDNRQFYLALTDDGGEPEWERNYGGPSVDWGYGLDLTDDGGFVMSGYTIVADPDACVIKTDSDGNVEWEISYGNYGSDVGFSVEQTSDGGFIIAGWTEAGTWMGEDICLTKLDSNGDLLWTTYFGSDGHDKSYYAHETSDYGIVVAGHVWRGGQGSSYDATVIKLEPVLTQAPSWVSSAFSLSAPVPNPARNGSSITLGLAEAGKAAIAVYDSRGRRVRELVDARLAGGEHSFVWDGRDDAGRRMAPGIYLIRVSAAGQALARKVVILD